MLMNGGFARRNETKAKLAGERHASFNKKRKRIGFDG